MKNYLIIGAIAAASFGSGIFFFNEFLINRPDAANGSSTIVRLGAQGLINPFLYAASKDSNSSFKPLKSKLNNKIKEDIQAGFSSVISVYFNDLNTGKWTGVNEDEKFAPASLLKVPTMIAYLKAAETDPAILRADLLYNGSFDGNAAEDIKPLKSIEAGHAYTADDLLRFMIGYSDNNAFLILSKYIGDPAVTGVINDLNIQYPTSTPTVDFMSPKEYSRFFRVLYSSTYLTKGMSQKALELLSYSDFPQGIESGLPEGTTVAQKFGERYFTKEDGVNKELHDCGIVYHPKNPYVLCIMTKGTDIEKMTAAIHDLSAVAWQEVNSWN